MSTQGVRVRLEYSIRQNPVPPPQPEVPFCGERPASPYEDPPALLGKMSIRTAATHELVADIYSDWRDLGSGKEVLDPCGLGRM